MLGLSEAQVNNFGSGVSRFFTWWAHELLDMLPAGFCARFSAPGRLTVFAIDDHTITVLVTGRDERLSVPRPVPDEGRTRIGACLRKNAGSWLRPRPVVLRLPLSDCLVRHVELPVEAKSRAAEILALDLERATPFKAQDICHGSHILNVGEGERSCTAEQIIAKREIVDAALAKLDEYGVQPAFIDVWKDDVSSAIPVDLSANEAPNGTGRHRFRSVRRFLVLTLVFLGAAAVALEFHRQETALATLEDQITTVRKRALAVRALIHESDLSTSRLSDLNERKTTSPGLSFILANLTRQIPDSAWLTGISVNDGRVQISGFAASAASLIETIEKSAYFSNASFAAPVTRDARQDRERFTIKFQLQTLSAGG